VRTVDEPGHALAFVGSARFDARSEDLDGACKVAADKNAWASDALDVLPVGRVLAWGDDFDEDLGWEGVWIGTDRTPLFGGDEDCFHLKGHGGEDGG
jgi:hypothetical protein